MTYKEIQCFEGALSGTEAIGIMVARSKKRFTKCAVNRAKRAKESAGYNIILTDEDNIYSDLIEYVVCNLRHYVIPGITYVICGTQFTYVICGRSPQT